MSEWHVRPIAKGVYGELSKIREELEEAEDAVEQNQPLMLVFELSDIVGAAAGVAAKYGFTMDDLVNFSKLRSKVMLDSEPELIPVDVEPVDEQPADMWKRIEKNVEEKLRERTDLKDIINQKRREKEIQRHLEKRREKTWSAFYRQNFSRLVMGK